MINSIPKSNINTGDITVEITPPTEANQSITILEFNSGSQTIPANSFWAIIENAGLVKSGDVPGDITINGASVSVGFKNKIESFYDTHNEVLEKNPAFTVVTTGSRVRIVYAS